MNPKNKTDPKTWLKKGVTTHRTEIWYGSCFDKEQLRTVKNDGGTGATTADF